MNGVISWNTVVDGVIAVIPASFFKGDWCYSSRSREKDLLQKFEKFGVIGVIAVYPAQNFTE